MVSSSGHSSEVCPSNVALGQLKASLYCSPSSSQVCVLRWHCWHENFEVTYTSLPYILWWLLYLLKILLKTLNYTLREFWSNSSLLYFFGLQGQAQVIYPHMKQLKHTAFFDWRLTQICNIFFAVSQKARPGFHIVSICLASELCNCNLHLPCSPLQDFTLGNWWVKFPVRTFSEYLVTRKWY